MHIKIFVVLALLLLGCWLGAADKAANNKPGESPKPAAAPANSSPIGVSFGLGADGVSWTDFHKYSGGQIESNIFRVNPYAYFDFIYGLVALGYETAAGELRQKTSSGNAVYYSLMGNEHLGFLTGKLVLKLPLELDKRFFMFPMVGVQFDWFVYSDYLSTYTEAAKADMSDLYLVLGLGADLFADSAVYIRFSFSFDINLTATPSAPISGDTYNGYKIKGGLALGSRL